MCEESGVTFDSKSKSYQLQGGHLPLFVFLHQARDIKPLNHQVRESLWRPLVVGHRIAPPDRPQAIESSRPRVAAEGPQGIEASSRHCSCCAFGSSLSSRATLVIKLLSECSRSVSTPTLIPSEYLVDICDGCAHHHLSTSPVDEPITCQDA